MTEAYWNLHKGKFSLRRKGKVIDRVGAAFFRSPRFVVQPAGHAKVVATRTKNVHAFVRGDLMETKDSYSVDALKSLGYKLASYNPFNGPYFYDKTTGEPIYNAKLAVVTGERQVWYK